MSENLRSTVRHSLVRGTSQVRIHKVNCRNRYEGRLVFVGDVGTLTQENRTSTEIY